MPEVEIFSLLEEQIPKYKLRADTLTQFTGYQNEVSTFSLFCWSSKSAIFFSKINSNSFRIGSCQVQRYKYHKQASDWIVIKFEKRWTISVSKLFYCTIFLDESFKSREVNFRRKKRFVYFHLIVGNKFLICRNINNTQPSTKCSLKSFIDQCKTARNSCESRKIDYSNVQRHLPFGVDTTSKLTINSIAIDGCRMSSNIQQHEWSFIVFCLLYFWLLIPFVHRILAWKAWIANVRSQ